MKQTLFEIKQRTDELMREAINTWRQSDFNEKMEGLENDPVFRLLMTALAYQANDISSEIERIKTEVLQEYAQLLVPYEVGRAVPATAVVQTIPDEDLGERLLNETDIFSIAETSYSFMPLLKTRVLNANVDSVVRVDGRRWKVTLTFNVPAKNLSNFAFAIKDENFKDCKVFIKDRQVPLINPWDLSELPFNKYFSIDTMLYNQTQVYEPSVACMDLFAKQNMRIFFISPYKPKDDAEIEKLEFIFEFSGIRKDFSFGKDTLILNPVVLVNANHNTATLTSNNPIVRVAGYYSKEQESKQFMHAIRPAEVQLFGASQIEIRRVAADRFNQGALVKLLNSLISKYSTDYFAFQNIRGLSGDRMMLDLHDILGKMLSDVEKNEERNVPGVYMILKYVEGQMAQDVSLNVDYLTTDGALLNDTLKKESRFIVPAGLNGRETMQVAEPVKGFNEVRGQSAELSLSRYYLATADRMVTRADIKMFCVNELITHYGITSKMIRKVMVTQHFDRNLGDTGYEILVNIVLADHPVIRKGFADQVEKTEILLEKMIEVRSANIYPINVHIEIENDKKTNT